MIGAIPSLIQMFKTGGWDLPGWSTIRTRVSTPAMLRQFRKFPRIHGQIVPGRRFTANAAYYFALFIAAPLLGIALVLDFIGWLITVKLFGASCYGVMCLFS